MGTKGAEVSTSHLLAARAVPPLLHPPWLPAGEVRGTEEHGDALREVEAQEGCWEVAGCREQAGEVPEKSAMPRR